MAGQNKSNARLTQVMWVEEAEPPIFQMFIDIGLNGAPAPQGLVLCPCIQTLPGSYRGEFS